MFVEHLDKQMVKFQGVFLPCTPDMCTTSHRNMFCLTVHAFLEPQPVKDAAVFFLRFILHNWADE
jgi:hypothetical protein